MTQENRAQGTPPQPTQDNAGVVAPPVLIYVVGILAGFALDFALPYPLLPGLHQYWVGGLMIAIGGLGILLAYLKFRQVDNDPRPWKPTTAFVAEGIYRHTRNPMYVSFSLLHLGAAVAGDCPWVLATLLPVLALIHFGVILREERYLEGLFGQDYLRYKATVRRWV